MGNDRTPYHWVFSSRTKRLSRTIQYNQLAKIIDQQIAIKHMPVKYAPPPSYKYLPAPVLESASVLGQVNNNKRTANYNKPDMVRSSL